MSSTVSAEPRLERADVFFTRGTSLVSRGIRWFTRRIGEKRTMVNHVGIVVSDGPPYEVLIIEALSMVRKHKLVRYDDDSSQVAVYRALDLSEEDRRTIVEAAEEYEGRKYGWGQIALHFLDWMLLGAYVFRRFGSDRYPICSWLVAFSFHRAGKTFGTPPAAANPDDIWDYVVTRGDEYECVRNLELLRGKTKS